MLKKINAGPVARADQATTDEDHGTTINVLVNDRNTPSSSSHAGLQVASTDTRAATLLPLAVDLDGTLLATDTLHEGLVAALLRDPGISSNIIISN